MDSGLCSSSPGLPQASSQTGLDHVKPPTPPGPRHAGGPRASSRRPQWVWVLKPDSRGPLSALPCQSAPALARMPLEGTLLRSPQQPRPQPPPHSSPQVHPCPSPVSLPHCSQTEVSRTVRPGLSSVSLHSGSTHPEDKSQTALGGFQGLVDHSGHTPPIRNSPL